MPEPKTSRVLLCGGHLDGQWVDVPQGARSYRAMEPQPVTFIEPHSALAMPLPDFVEYQLEPMPIQIRYAGGHLWVGTIGYGPERDEAIARALFQRDVAQQMLGTAVQTIDEL